MKHIERDGKSFAFGFHSKSIGILVMDLAQLGALTGHLKCYQFVWPVYFYRLAVIRLGNVVSLAYLVQSFGKDFNPENYRTRGNEHHVRLIRKMMSAQIIGREIHDLLRRSSTLDRGSRLSEYGIATLEIPEHLPGVFRIYVI